MVTYGKTWWGQKWLETFNDIDDQNRLARGRTYANTGRAYDIKIKDNYVTAKVQGSRPTPYKVKIGFKNFDQSTQEELKKIITDSPLILSNLLNKKLPQQILQHLEQANIKLFPSSWREIEASCTCPDWAMPCKHIASVVYLLCNQIDKNPFSLFEVHNCDLLSLLGEYQDAKITDVQKITSPQQIFKPHKAPGPTQENNLTIDLSKIPNLQKCILTILDNNPPFYDKNFRDILEMAYKYWQTYPRGQQKRNISLLETTSAKKIKAHRTEEEIFLEKWKTPEKIENCYLSLSKDCFITFIEEGDCKIINCEENESFRLTAFLDQLPHGLLYKLSPKIRFFHTLYQVAVSLVHRSAIIPQIIQNQNEGVWIRWIPALFDPHVHDIYKQLCEACPSDLVVYNRQTISAEEQIKTAIGWLIAGLIDQNLPKSLINKELPSVFELFFSGEKINFQSFSEKEIPISIHQWLSKLFLIEKTHKLYLQIEEQHDEFELKPQIILNDTSDPISIKKALELSDGPTRLEILSDLFLISQYFPEFDAVVQNFSPMRFTLDEFTPLFLDILPALQAIGVVVVLPKGLHKILKPKINLSLKSSSDLSLVTTGILSLENILDFNWKIAIGDQSLSIEEFKKILKNSKNLVKLVDNYVLLDEKEIELLLKQIDKLPQSLTSGDLLQAMLAEELDGAMVSLDHTLEKFIASLGQYEHLPIPHNLNASLRPYQERGFNWLIQNIRCSFGSILADDMGLGKTIQVISVILYLKNNEHLDHGQRAIIVAPTGLLSNWEKEFKKFAPDIITHTYHGNKRELLTPCDVILTSYGLVRSDHKELNKIKCLLLVIDEAHNIKNPYSEQTKAIKSIAATHKIAMSGTPVENRLMDYWSIFDFTNKLYLGTLKQFKERYAVSIEKEYNQECLERFKKITSPFILRRLKNDKTIINDLPEKIESNRYSLLTPEQTALYQNVIDTSIEKIEISEGIERKGLVLKLINSLKKICNHPAHFNPSEKNISITQSGKTIMLESILSEIDNSGERCLIFTQYVEMGDILVQLISETMNMQVPFLHGGISRVARDRIIQDFQNPMSHTRFLIISLKAGGTGLNLTAANHVIHYDLWWNPAVEQQATDRAYRIGQKKNVMVHRFITSGSFEESIDEMLKTKKELANLVVSDGESWITEMSTAQITDLVALKQV